MRKWIVKIHTILKQFLILLNLKTEESQEDDKVKIVDISDRPPLVGDEIKVVDLWEPAETIPAKVNLISRKKREKRIKKIDYKKTVY